MGEKPLTLNEWQLMFNGIYGECNAKIDENKIWLHLVEEAGKVAEDMRKEKYAPLWDGDLPDVFAWLCAYCNHRGIKLDEIVWNKFPAVCPYCLSEENCQCHSGAYSEFEDERLIDFRKMMERKPRSLEEWQGMLERIYKNVNEVESRKGIGYHLFEEIAEVAEEIRRDDRIKRNLELADVFCWIFAVVMKLQDDFYQRKFNDALWGVYQGKCKICGKEVCEGELWQAKSGPKK